MIKGHKKQIEFLEKVVSSGHLPHALLFQGISGLGKKSLAIHLFKTINCQEKSPCNVCQNCLSVDNASHPDFVSVEPNGNVIQIGQIRELIRRTSFRPYSAPFKWAIINDAHLMNREAANSLLKTLEEPKGRTVLFLVTEYPEMIVATIKSRMQKIKFFPLKKEEVVSLLESKGCENDKACEIASFSFGRPGIAIDFLSNFEKIEKRKKKIKELAEIVSSKSPFYSRFQYAEKLSSDSDNLRETLEIWLSYLRGLLLEKSKKQEINYSYKKLKLSLESVEKTIHLISETSVNPRLATEVLLMNL